MFHLSHRLFVRGLNLNTTSSGRNQCIRLPFYVANQFSGIVQLGAYNRLRGTVSNRTIADTRNSHNLVCISYILDRRNETLKDGIKFAAYHYAF